MYCWRRQTKAYTQNHTLSNAKLLKGKMMVRQLYCYWRWCAYIRCVYAFVLHFIVWMEQHNMNYLQGLTYVRLLFFFPLLAVWCLAFSVYTHHSFQLNGIRAPICTYSSYHQLQVQKGENYIHRYSSKTCNLYVRVFVFVSAMLQKNRWNGSNLIN